MSAGFPRPGNSFDVLIVGAGINGCSAARELSRLGYSVLLADQGDLGGATTARSGRVLHCGLQLLAPRRSVIDYLKNPFELAMRLRSAWRAARDFEEFRTRPPRLLEPMTTFVPIFRDSPYAGWQVDLGASIIGALAGSRAGFQYRRLDREGGRSNPFVPALGRADALQSMVCFRDFRFCWPERIAIDAALAAERNGAAVMNFTKVVGISRGSEDDWHAKLVGDNGREWVISARLVLNLAGVWVDRVIESVEPARAVTRKTVAVKGVYLLARLPEQYRGLGLAGTNGIGEPICCMPWDDLHYIGPTETLFTGSLDDVRPQEEEIAFLLEEIGKFAPGLSITRSRIVMAWAGIRPITAADGYPKGRRLPFNIIHDLAREGMPNMLALSWGIIANHRSTARALARAVSARVRPSGSPRLAGDEHVASPGTGRRLQDDHPATDDDVRSCVKHEHAKDLTGVLFSRTGLGWTGRMTAEAVYAAADAMAPLLSWSQGRTRDECARFRAMLKTDHCYELR